MKKEKISGLGAYQYLPPGYDLYEMVDLARDRKTLIGVNISAAAIMIAMVVYAVLWEPRLRACFDQGLPGFLGALALMLGGTGAYIVLHELIHGIFIRFFSGEKARYGVELSKGYAYTKSDYFFGKTAYIIIALSPVVIWGIVLFVLMNELPPQLFTSLFFIQAMNLGGAAGDYYVTWRILRMPKGVLVIDAGTSMKFFAPVNFEDDPAENL